MVDREQMDCQIQIWMPPVPLPLIHHMTTQYEKNNALSKFHP